ncbi:hypothetical protein [Candidatus Proelusimicrobium excrementi]|uniref:hypothetical protein n=1 Tax=Candidatus Proelusimicrobium excrementi TaxID=3416222 RepID=UPI003CA61450|nr:hypothetical protein [Elusimicrobiaceae bacterium]
MLITDLSQNPAVNKSVKLTEIAACTNGRSECVSLLATGSVSGGEIKLQISQDDANYYPLTDENGVQIILKPNTPLYLKFANLYLKCDLSGISSDNLKITVQ